MARYIWLGLDEEHGHVDERTRRNHLRLGRAMITWPFRRLKADRALSQPMPPPGSGLTSHFPCIPNRVLATRFSHSYPKMDFRLPT